MKLLALLVVAALTASADAQVRYFVQSGGVTTGPLVPVFDSQTPPNIEIDIGVRNDAPFIQIVDLSGAQASVGTITIRGANTDAAGGEKVSVAICSASAPDVAFGDPELDRVPGLRNLGGLVFAPPLNNPSDTSLARSSRVSVTVLGDISGDIVAGQIYRVDALRNSGEGYGGTISGTIRATIPDGQGVLDGFFSPAIPYVRAGWEISGEIIADGGTGLNGNPTFDPADVSTWGSISSVIVGPSLSAPGLTGNVLCDFGRIQQIVSSGPIGAGTALADRSVISAGVRIGYIGTRVEGTVGDAAVLDRPIRAQVTASSRGVVPTQLGNGSCLSLIQTGGDFVGDILIHDFYGPNDGSGSTTETGRKGIFVGGDFIGNIRVTHSYEGGDMIARSFRGTISIGNMLLGAIVAVGRGNPSDPLDGSIFSISVGYGYTVDVPRARPNGMSPVPGDIMPPPFEGSFRDNWYTAWPVSGSIADSVIRADGVIDNIRVKAISCRLIDGAEGKARIEAPVIENLEIGYFDSGAVWSGRLNSSSSTVTNNIADDYSSISTALIGCMGAKADLWVQYAADVQVAGDCFGEIRVPSLEAQQIIRIGGRFGDLDQAEVQVGLCEAEYDFGNGPYVYKYHNVEDSPRGVWRDEEETGGVATYARVRIQADDALAGQIVLDAQNATGAHRTATHWRGDVEIGTGDPADPNRPMPFAISADAGRASIGGEAPFYSIASAPLGGGAVGLVPFALYESDCDPLNDDPNGPSILNTEFNNQPSTGITPRGVVLRFYGPVRTEASSSASNPFLQEPVQVDMTFRGWPPPPPANVTNRVNAVLVRDPATAASREVVVIGDGSYRHAALTYSVTPVLSGSNMLLCDEVPAAVAVLPFSYLFDLGQDCNSDGQPDSPQEAAPCTGCQCADWDGSGGVDGDDITAFLIDWQMGNADCDLSGGTDGQDVDAFYLGWGAGGGC